MHHLARDISGQRFGRLVAHEATDERTRGNVVWTCFCDCGMVTKHPVNLLVAEKIRSCGCVAGPQAYSRYGRPFIAPKMILAFDRWWRAYALGGSPLDRMTPKWETFAGFYADMGDAPTISAQLWRYDRDADYSLANCYWHVPEGVAAPQHPSSLLWVSPSAISRASGKFASQVMVDVEALRSRSLAWSVCDLKFPHRFANKAVTPNVDLVSALMAVGRAHHGNEHLIVQAYAKYLRSSDAIPFDIPTGFRIADTHLARRIMSDVNSLCRCVNRYAGITRE